MNVLLATVQYTGTCFFLKILQQYLETPGVSYSTRPVLQIHTTASKMDTIVEESQSRVLITTVRNWDDCRASWKRRGHRTGHFDEQVKCWTRLLELDPIIVSIDCQREARLRRLGDALGVDFKTDWASVNAHPHKKIMT